MIRKLERTRRNEAWIPLDRPLRTRAERDEEIRQQGIKDARQAVKGIRHLLEELVESTPSRADRRIGNRRG